MSVVLSVLKLGEYLIRSNLSNKSRTTPCAVSVTFFCAISSALR